MQLLDGKKLAEDIRAQLARDISDSNIIPGLAAVLVGDDPASHIYVRLKEKAAKEVGVYFEKVELPIETSEQEIIDVINTLNSRDNIHGILVQLPLPEQVDTNHIINAIDPKKDADGFHPENIKLLNEGSTRIISPPHAGILKFLEETNMNLESKKVALLVNSHEFADPLEQLLSQNGMEVAKLIKEKNYQPYTQKADIVIVAVGKANLITEDDIKNNAILIDVGTNKINGKVVGDIDFESVKDKASFITPVPGGVGPMTVAYLLQNTYTLAMNYLKETGTS